MKKGGQLAGMPKLLWLVLFLWWHYAAVGWATGVVWWLNSKAKAQGQSHIRGMQGLSTKTAVGAWLGQFRSVKSQREHLEVKETFSWQIKSKKTKPARWVTVPNQYKHTDLDLARAGSCWTKPCSQFTWGGLLQVQCWQGRASRTWRSIK